MYACVCHILHSRITQNESPHLAACACCSVDVVVYALTKSFLLHAPYLSILVLSEEPGFRETLSYFRRQRIVLSEEAK